MSILFFLNWKAIYEQKNGLWLVLPNIVSTLRQDQQMNQAYKVICYLSQYLRRRGTKAEDRSTHHSWIMVLSVGSFKLVLLLFIPYVWEHMCFGGGYSADIY